MTSIKIYDSQKYSEDEMREFLEYLKEYEDEKTDEKIYGNINIEKILNEWYWHKLVYLCRFEMYNNYSADIFFNHDDIDHWYSRILNWRLWF